MSLQGGIYMEAGVYLEVSLVAKSETLKAEADANIYQTKFPLFSLGDRYVLLKFDGPGSLLINSNAYSLADSGLYNAEYLDMTTGKEVTGNFTDPSKFIVVSSTPYLSQSGSDLVVNKDLFGTPRSRSDPGVPKGTKRIDATLTVYYTGNNLLFSSDPYNGAIKTVPVTWVDQSIPLSDYPDLKPVTATYVLDENGKKTTLAAETVPFGEVPGLPNLSNYMQHGVVTGYSADPTQAILKDTTYTVHLADYQKLVSFLTYQSDGNYHLDVYAVNAGDTPKPPAGYNSASGVDFNGWEGLPGFHARLPAANAVTAVDFNAQKFGNEFLYTGLDTSKPLFSASGTYEQVYGAYVGDKFPGDSAYSYADCSQYLYMGLYGTSAPITIHFNYPEMKIVKDGSTIFNEPAISYPEDLPFGKQAFPPMRFSFPGYTLKGWSLTDGGDVVYTNADLPDATRNMTLYAVVETNHYTVTVQNRSGGTTETDTVPYGAAPPAVLDSPPAVSGYQFLYWDVSTDGGKTFQQYTADAFPGVFTDWVVKPIYNKVDTLTFNYPDGSAQTKQIAEGSPVRLGSLSLPAPAEAADNYNSYSFSGWKDQTGKTYAPGDSLTATGDMTFTAQFAATPLVYRATFTTPAGTFGNGQQTISFSGGYDDFNRFVSDTGQSIKTQSPETADTVYFYERIDRVETAARDYSYTVVWSSSPRIYTVTFNAGEGSFDDHSAKATQPYHYGDTVTAPANIVPKPRDATGTYKLKDWKDQNGNILTGSTAAVSDGMVYTAEYETDVPESYTVSFDAGGGCFNAGGAETQTQTLGYGSALTLPGAADVTKPADASHTYSLAGWRDQNGTSYAPGASVTVTGNLSFTAFYKYENYTFTATGMTISDGTHTEDISSGGNGAAAVAGYTYSMADAGDGHIIPLLVITKNGLTLSGTDTAGVYVSVAAGVADVTLDNLNLTGDHPYGLGALVVGEENGSPVTVNIKGACSIASTGNLFETVRLSGPVTLTGDGGGAALTVTAADGSYSSALFANDAFTVQNLALNISETAKDGDPDGNWCLALGTGDYGDAQWLFDNATLHVTSDGFGFYTAHPLKITDSVVTVNAAWGGSIVDGNVVVSGHSDVKFTSSDPAYPALTVKDAQSKAAGGGRLTFATDFTGSFEAKNSAAGSGALAVLAESGISGIPAGYLPNGTTVDNVSSDGSPFTYNDGITVREDVPYYTFVDANEKPVLDIWVKEQVEQP